MHQTDDAHRQHTGNLVPMVDDEDFPESDLTREVIGAFFDVYNYFRPGYLEAVYAGGMASASSSRFVQSIPIASRATLIGATCPLTLMIVPGFQ